LLSAAVHSADIQDRDGAGLVLDKRTRALFPFIMRIFADAPSLLQLRAADFASTRMLLPCRTTVSTLRG
jgi:hypothetical protein